MRLLIANLTGGGLSGGYRTYLRELLPRLLKSSEVDLAINVLPSGTLKQSSETQRAEIEMPMKREPFSSIKLQKIVEQMHIDVVFVPTSRAPFVRRPVVTMVRNMEPLTHPFTGNSITDKAKNLGRFIIAKNACRRSQRIIAVSNHVKTFLTAEWMVEESKIGVVSHGVSLINYSEPIEKIFSSGIREFIFVAGSLRPARGLEDVIKVMESLGGDSGLHCVIAGGIDKGAEDYISKLKNQISKKIYGQVHWVGELKRSQMRWCYENALAFVMTSRVEACPNIALEAMKHGAVCISNRQNPMPEFFGNAARYYEISNLQGLSDLIVEIRSLSLEDRLTMRETAIERSKKFDWDVTAEKTIEQLKIAAQQFPKIK